MIGYKVEKINYYGMSEDCGYSLDKKKAIQIMNKAIRDTFSSIAGDRVTNKEDMPDYNVKEDFEIICKFPYFMIKKGDKIVTEIPYWEKCSYEYSEYDVYSVTIVMKPIDIVI